MTPDQPNPYASPVNQSTAAPVYNIDPATMKKIEAIIKDAGQFWLAIIICILCSALGSIIIGPWYLIRLLQWNSIARAQPLLLDRDAPRGSLPQRFQSAKVKLIIGMSFGVAIFALIAMLFLVSFASALGSAQAG